MGCKLEIESRETSRVRLYSRWLFVWPSSGNERTDSLLVFAPFTGYLCQPAHKFVNGDSS